MQHRRWWLLAILAIALLLRVFRVTWGLPDFIPPDGLNYYIRPAARLVALGELVPPSFVHSPLFVYTIGLVDFAYTALTGESIDLSPRPLRPGLGGILPPNDVGLLGSLEFPPQLTNLILAARAFCVVVATLSVGVLYLLTRRLAGDRAALLASAAFALSPLHVLESHRVNADGLMILLALSTAHLSVLSLQRRDRRGIVAAFALAGVTAAIRYNGLAIVTLPTWVVLRWPGAAAAQRLRLLIAGGAAVSVVLVIGLLPALFDWERFKSVVVALFSAGFVASGNFDLSGDGWVYNRYVYQLVATLPYSLGWAVYISSLLGLALLARFNRPVFGIVLAAIVPFFLVQGASLTVEHRYYQLMLPFLALTAGVALDEAAARWRSGRWVVCAVLVYTAALTGSHCLRLGLAPQRAIAELVHLRASDADADGALAIAYPGPVDLLFDPLRTQIRRGVASVHHIPHLAGDSLEAMPEPMSEEELTQRLREWLASKRIELIVLPDWQEDIAARSSGRPVNARKVYALLANGALGYRQVAEHRTGFLTEALYTWPDPLLETHRALGILGYKLFVRTETTQGAG